ncbi:retrovirus-related pol polyprotein from transposon TNT 1-94 [Tanacetum coccineum]
MTGNVSLLCNFVEKYLGTVRFGNDQFAPILGYGDLVQGNITIKRVYYVEGLNHNLFSVGQFCDADLEAEAIATACYTQNRSIIIPTHEKMAYHIINDRKPSFKHLHIFGCTCYLTRDGENLDKMKEKGDPCILAGYSTQSKGYRVYNKRTRLIVESIHLIFDEIKEMSETSVANDTLGLVPQQQKASDYDNPDPAPDLQNVSPSANTTVPSQQELDLLFGPLNPSKPVQTRRQLATDPEMCMFALTVSTAEPKNIKEAMLISAWIEAMQEELQSFDNYKYGKRHSIVEPKATKPKLECRFDVKRVDQTDYRSKIASLMYLTSSRPDIMQAVCYYAGYQARLTEKHLKEVKRIFRYLRGTINMGLWYLKGSGFDLTAFSDADHAGCVDTRKALLEENIPSDNGSPAWMSNKKIKLQMSIRRG